jgi:hypothetical protein
MGEKLMVAHKAFNVGKLLSLNQKQTNKKLDKWKKCVQCLVQEMISSRERRMMEGVKFNYNIFDIL